MFITINSPFEPKPARTIRNNRPIFQFVCIIFVAFVEDNATLSLIRHFESRLL